MPSTLKFAATIGLDWADQKHDLWLQAADASQPEHSTIAQTPEALHEWVAALRQRFDNQPVAIALETSRGPVISALMAYDFLILYPVNPAALCNYRKAFSVSGAKDDRTDAMLLEEYLRLHHARLRPLRPDTELTRRLAGLVEARRHFVDQRTRLVNQLHSLLKSYYPLAEILLDDLTIPLAADFLVKWPTLESLQKAGAPKMRAFFYGHHSRSARKMAARETALQNAKALTRDPALIIPASLKAQTLAGLLQTLHRSIAQFDELIQAAMDQHPDAPIFRSFPNAGPALAPRLLVAFGTDRERFTSATEIQQFYGVAPVKIQSGNTCVFHMRHHCPKFGRQTFHEHAGMARLKAGWAQTYYEHQKAKKNGSHHKSIRALSFKLVRIYFRCWQDRKPYDPNIYEVALKKHGSSLLEN